jgi:hypothetical protein
MIDSQTCLRFYSSTRADKWVERDDVGKEGRQSFEERSFPRTLWSGAPKGRDISAQGKRSAALGGGLHQSLALKGRNKRHGGKFVSPFQGFPLEQSQHPGRRFAANAAPLALG